MDTNTDQTKKLHMKNFVTILERNKLPEISKQVPKNTF